MGARRVRPILILAAVLGLAANPGAAREIPITILCTTDLHGHVLPVRDAEGREVSGGLLRCATRIEELRAREPNVLLVDCGDLVQGSAESWLTRGRIMLDALERLRYDAWVIGNHDFDWGLDALVSLHDRCATPMLGANIRAQEGTRTRLGRIQPFVVREIDGVRVALVGLTTPGIPLWLRPEMLGNARFSRSVETLAEIMPSVRAAAPDVMVLLVHQGYQVMGDDAANEINQIARNFPEFDAVLGGHLHKAVPGSRPHGVLYVQAGSHGGGVGRVEIVFDTVQRRVVRTTGEVLPVGPEVPPSETLRAALAADLDRAEAHLDEVIGEAACEMPAAAGLPAQSPVQQLVATAIAKAAKAEVVLHGLLAEESIRAGPVRRRDAWRVVPYENRIGVLSLTAQELRDILEENAAQAGSIHFLGAYGIRYDLAPDAPAGHRIRNLALADGTRPHPRRRLRVAFNSYTLASGGGRFPTLRRLADLPTSRARMTDIDTRSALVEYVRKRSPVCAREGDGVRVVRGAAE